MLQEPTSLIHSKSTLALTNHTNFVVVQVMYSTPVQKKSNEILSSFNTTFIFSMVNPYLNDDWSGFSFNYTTPLLVNITSNRRPYNHLLAVEFDMRRTVELEDPDDNHVGMDINNLISVKTAPAGY